MRLTELYPYWADTHDELLERLRVLTQDRLDFKPYSGTPSIRQIAVAQLGLERQSIAGLAAGFDTEPVRLGQYPDGKALAEGLAAQRVVTERALEPLTAAGLRAVRLVPADQSSGRAEANMPIAWIVWHVLERERMAWGQILLRLDEYKASQRDL